MPKTHHADVMILAPQAPDLHTVMLPASCSAKGEIGLNPLGVTEFAPAGAAALLDKGGGWGKERWLGRMDMEEVIKKNTKIDEFEEKGILKTFDLQYAQVNE